MPSSALGVFTCAVLFVLCSIAEAHSNDTHVVWSVLDGGGHTIIAENSPTSSSPSPSPPSTPQDCEFVNCTSHSACKHHGCSDEQCAAFPAESEDGTHRCRSERRETSSTRTHTTSRNQTSTTTTHTSQSSTSTTTTSQTTSRWGRSFSELWSSKKLLMKDSSSIQTDGQPTGLAAGDKYSRKLKL